MWPVRWCYAGGDAKAWEGSRWWSWGATEVVGAQQLGRRASWGEELVQIWACEASCGGRKRSLPGSLEKVSILMCAKNSRQRKCTINHVAFILAPLLGRRYNLHKKWNMEIGLDI
ncbi:hypothetical protein Taro_024894 [Colocasia esculenta]|uniref:Uncharacterized protein n=1 Tax=Colocasia esculenta TaxID=4460 RepID=A0A843VFW5_COLES|nr:hypothetical protein [Colocasia esculenta]